MTGNVRSIEELTEKQAMLITALLSLPTIEAASKAVGISDRTARRWFHLSHFQTAYKAAKRIAFDKALDELRDNVSIAITTLKNMMADSSIDPAVRVRCAQIWLSNAIQTHKVEDLEQRIVDLEEKQ